MKSRTLILRAGMLVALALPAIAGCGGGGNNNSVLNPAFQPEVANNIDNFQFQATGVTGVTQTLTYTWRNTGTQANVDQSCSLSGGSATLVARDSTGAQVYSRNLAESGSFASATGLAGNWTLQVSLVGAKGNLNFRAQKKT